LLHGCALCKHPNQPNSNNLAIFDRHRGYLRDNEICQDLGPQSVNESVTSSLRKFVVALWLNLFDRCGHEVGGEALYVDSHSVHQEIDKMVDESVSFARL
jgi:hypothetical protein